MDGKNFRYFHEVERAKLFLMDITYIEITFSNEGKL
jgi:hypothetical protein